MRSILKHINRFTGSGTFKNSYWSLADVLLYPVLMTLLTPLYIRYLGVEQYGIWMLAGNIAQMMNALNMGVGESTIREVSRNRALNDVVSLNAAVSRNLFLSLLLFVVSCIAGIVISYALERLSFFKIEASALKEAGLLIILLNASVGIRFIELVLLSVFKGFERFDIAAKLSALSRNGPVLGGIVVLLCGYGFIEILWLTLLLNIINILIQVACIRKFYTQLTLVPVFSKNLVPELIRTNGWYWLQFVIALAGFLADRFLAAHYGGMKFFGYYSIAAMIGAQIHSIAGTLGTFAFPRVSFLREQQADTKRIYFVASGTISGFGFAGILLLLVFGDPLFNAWLGAETWSLTSNFVRLYLVYEAIVIVSIVPYQFINGTQFVRYNSLFELSMRLLQVILMVVLFRTYGINGIIYGLIAGASTVVPIQLYLFARSVIRANVWSVIRIILPALAFIAFVFTETLLSRCVIMLVIVALYGLLVLPSAYRYYTTGAASGG